MKIRIISFRRSDDKGIRALEEDYLKRFTAYSNVELIDIKRSKMNQKKASVSDLAKLKTHLCQGDYCVMLSDDGQQYTTVQFTQFLKSIINKGTHSLTFLIGGPEGFPTGVEELVHEKLSLSKMTLPHKLVRLLLIEAMYRSFDIMRGGKYNK